MRGRHALFSSAALALVALATAAIAWAGPDTRNVQMLDNCDGPEFQRGDRSRHLFTERGPDVRQVRRRPIEKGAVESWRFSPEKLSVDAGSTITAVNRGGEDHTFSEVDEFGGGCIADVNELLDLEAVPECDGFPGPPGGPFFFATLAAPGESVTTAPLAAGTHKFLCLIHPWMQATVTAR